MVSPTSCGAIPQAYITVVQYVSGSRTIHVPGVRSSADKLTRRICQAYYVVEEVIQPMIQGSTTEDVGVSQALDIVLTVQIGDEVFCISSRTTRGNQGSTTEDVAVSQALDTAQCLLYCTNNEKRWAELRHYSRKSSLY